MTRLYLECTRIPCTPVFPLLVYSTFPRFPGDGYAAKKKNRPDRRAFIGFVSISSRSPRLIRFTRNTSHRVINLNFLAKFTGSL